MLIVLVCTTAMGNPTTTPATVLENEEDVDNAKFPIRVGVLLHRRA